MKKKEYKYFVTYTFKGDGQYGNGSLDIAYGKICSGEDIGIIRKYIEQYLIDEEIVSDDVKVIITNWKRYDR